MRYSRLFILIIYLVCLTVSGAHLGCEKMLAPEQTPTRVIIYFLKEAGRLDLEAASEWVMPEYHDQIESWAKYLFFPVVEEPPTQEDGSRVDRFIGHCYRITVIDEGETEATARLVFAATDAIANYPSLADAPLPNSALYMVTLVKPAEGEGEDIKYGDWRITSMAPTTEHR